MTDKRKLIKKLNTTWNKTLDTKHSLSNLAISYQAEGQKDNVTRCAMMIAMFHEAEQMLEGMIKELGGNDYD